jgi:hypothetical protein
MGIQITVYGSHPFTLAYDDSEIIAFISDYITKRKNTRQPYFTYFTLCRIILEKAKNDNKLKGMEPNTYYESPDLAQSEYTRISRILWGFIWDKKIYVDFSNNSYIAHYENDTILGIM